MSDEAKDIIVKQAILKQQNEWNEQIKFNAKYVTSICQLDILTLTVVVFVQVPAKKFKNNFSGMLFRSSSSYNQQPSKSRNGFRVEIRTAQTKKHKNMAKPRTL